MHFILLALLIPSISHSQDTKENAEFKLAVNLYNDKMYDLAAEQLKRFIETYPNTSQGIQARFYLGQTQIALKQYEEARLTFQNFALSYPDHPQAPDAWWNVAEAYVAMNNLPEAASAFERLKVFHPKSKRAPEALLKAAAYFRHAGTTDRVKKVLRTLIQDYPTSSAVPEARMILSEIYSEEGNHEQALAELKRVFQKASERDLKSRALLLMGETYERQQKTEDAERTYREVIQSYPKTQGFAEAAYRLGFLQQESGRPFESITSFKNALIDTSTADADLRLRTVLAIAKSYYMLRDFSNTDLYLDQVLALKPSPTVAIEAHRLAAVASEETRDYRRALEHYQAILLHTGKTDEKALAYIGAGRASKKLEDFRGAITYFQKFFEEYPNHVNAPDALFAIGQAYREGIGGIEGTKNAMLTFESLLSRYPRSYLVDDALYQIADLHEQAKEFDQAVRSYSELIKRYPASPFSERARERIHWLTTFEPTPSGASLNKLAQLLASLIAGESKGESAFHLGQIYFNDLKDFHSAARMFASAIENKVPEPNLAEAYYYRARSLQLHEEKNQIAADSALRAYEQFVQRYPMHSHSRDAAAAAAIIRIVFSPGIDVSKVAEEFIVKYPGSNLGDTVLLVAGKTLMNQAKYDRAALAFRQLMGWFPSSPFTEEALYHLGLVFENSGKRDSAQSSFSAFLQRYPGSPRALDVLTRKIKWLSEEGRRHETIEPLRTVIERFPYAPEAEAAEFALAEAYAAGGDLDSAIAQCQRVLKKQEENLFEQKVNPELHFLLATLFQQKRNKHEAKKYYLTYLREGRSGHNAPEALFRLAQLYREGGNIETAISYLKQAVALSGERRYREELADLYFDREDYSSADTLLATLAETASSAEERMRFDHRLIVSMIRQGKLDVADAKRREFEKSYKEVNEQLAELELERGNYRFKKQEYTPALHSFENLIKQYKKSKLVPSAHYWIGKTYEATGQNQKAQEKYLEVVKTFPSAEILPRVYLALGNISYRTENFDSAVVYYKRVVEDPMTPKDLLPFAMNNLIEAYKAVGLLDAALDLTRKFIAAYPDDDSIQDKRIDIAVLYQKLGYYDQSILHLENLLETADSELEGEIRYYIGEGYFGKGNYERAILEFLKVPYLVTKKGLVDWTANSFYMSGQAYEKMGKYEEAIGMYKQIVDRPGIDQTFKAAALKEIDRVNSLVKKPPRKPGD